MQFQIQCPVISCKKIHDFKITLSLSYYLKTFWHNKHIRKLVHLSPLCIGYCCSIVSPFLLSLIFPFSKWELPHLWTCSCSLSPSIQTHVIANTDWWLCDRNLWKEKEFPKLNLRKRESGLRRGTVFWCIDNTQIPCASL